jgi:hypothetical protein
MHYAHADCNNNIPGNRIQFVKTSTDNQLTLDSWVTDRFHPKKIDMKTLYGNKAVFQEDVYFRRFEKLADTKNQYEYFRYYKATMENCDVIWAKFRENDPRLNYFWIKNRIIKIGIDDNVIDTNDNIDFIRAADYLNIVHENTINRLIKHIGKEAAIIPHESDTIKIERINSAQSTTSRKIAKLNKLKNEQYLISGISLIPKVINDNHSAIISVELTSKLSGAKIYEPWGNRSIILERDAFKNVRSEYENDISLGKIRYGMNYSEILKSWGQPIKIRYSNNPLAIPTDIQEPSETNIVDKRFFEITIANEVRMEQNDFNMIWHYKKDFLPKNVIVFDHNGVLVKSLQLPQKESELSFAEESFY